MEILDWVKKQTDRITDNVKNYKFYVKYQPLQINTASTLTISTFTDRNQTGIVPCLFEWFIIKNTIEKKVINNKSNTYICQPNEIGSIIKAKVTSTDPQYPGIALIQLGPVRLDPILRVKLENILKIRQIKIKTRICLKNKKKQVQLKVTPNQFILRDYMSSEQFILKIYKIQEISKTNRFALQFRKNDIQNSIDKLMLFYDSQSDIANDGDQIDKRILIQCENREDRDKIILANKLFSVELCLKNSLILNKLQNPEYNEEIDIDPLIEIAILRDQNKRLIQQNSKLNSLSNICYREIDQLKKTIEQLEYENHKKYNKEQKFVNFSRYKMKQIIQMNRRNTDIQHQRKSCDNKKMGMIIKNQILLANDQSGCKSSDIASRSRTRNNTNQLQQTIIRVTSQKQQLSKQLQQSQIQIIQLKQHIKSIQHAYQIIKQNEQGSKIDSIDENIKNSKQYEQQIYKLKNQNKKLILQKQQVSKKYKNKISELIKQCSLAQRGYSAINRGYNMSIQLEKYQQQQIQLLKQEVKQLKIQNKRLQQIEKKQNQNENYTTILSYSQSQSEFCFDLT